MGLLIPVETRRGSRQGSLLLGGGGGGPRFRETSGIHILIPETHSGLPGQCWDKARKPA